ncbi:hypothetical protein WR164_14150 [Philodulcilactobacillus myokoensis]|uniref:HNH Cas9-type domain-containing protein n=1 Tax=Philodulcilactobacillus myokoensis TaxID=2929573 RepID=A0A9W6ESV3_9LACO|nr:type II CRISPR RNA-guided endonuclease Cas9 [Philodulcilactobacillus myokoensis]GLB47436.1 hypothetical protein WR164_14150 [Philodulcilactobacillus myokoensis]
MGNQHKISQDDFYSIMKNLFDCDAFQNIIRNSNKIKSYVDEISELIDNQNYLLKQRNNENGNIPHQIHQIELDNIIRNQSKYYPWLKEQQRKLDMLVSFRVPYYVGPMITKEDQQKSSNADFAWMVRKEAGQITPWNFNQKVNRMASANRFIKRMTVKDTYLLSEDVLPDNSLIYQEFKVLNELNFIKINGKRLADDVNLKHKIYNDLFKKNKTVSVKKLQNYFLSKLGYPNKPTITGLSNPKKFNNGLIAYNDYHKIFGEQIDNPDLQDDFERIIEWSTVFEDRNIFEQKLLDIKWLTKDQRKQLINKRYNGWGRLSKKLLTGLRNKQGERIIDVLWNERANFMQAISDPSIKEQIDKINGQQVHEMGMESILDDAYTSPQNKKAIRQVMKVVEDIQRAMGGQAPTSISIEFTRNPEDNSEIKKSRASEINKKYVRLSKQIDKGLMDEFKSAKKKYKGLTDRLYLYFTQRGKDIYTGHNLNIDQLQDYDIDHIIPQSFMKDNSLSNRVLTSSSINHEKGDATPLDGLSNSSKCNIYTMIPKWQSMERQGLISKRKLKNLQLRVDKINKYVKNGFVHRQLVETSQVIKLVANILKSHYQSDDTKIIEIKAKMNSEMRDTFDLYKSREENDYHHALDAYLTTFNGCYLYRRYPKLRNYFVYSDFKKFASIDNVKNLNNFTFLHDITNPRDKNENKIYNNDGDLILKRLDAIKYIKSIYNYKFMLITHEVSTRKGQLFNQSVYPAGNVHSKIKIKKDRPVNIYGGHSGNTDAYMMLVKINDPKGTKYKVVGLSLRYLDKVNRLKKNDSVEYKKMIHQIAGDSLSKKDRKNGYQVVLDKLMYRQLIIDGDEKYTLGSSTYKYNARQLVFNNETNRTMALLNPDRKVSQRYHSDLNELSDKEISQRFVDAYQDILNKVNKYLPLYDKSNFRNGLNKGLNLFRDLPNYYINKQNGKFDLLINILNGIHANPTYISVKEIGIKTPLGQMQYSSGINLSPNAYIIYQSPTGLFERKLQVKKL